MMLKMLNIFLCSFMLILTGCTASRSVVTNDIDAKAPLVQVIQADSGLDSAGGPRAVTTYMVIYNRDGTVKTVLQNAHAGPGSLQTVAPALVNGAAITGASAITGHYALKGAQSMAGALKNRSPQTVVGDTTTVFALEGGDAFSNANSQQGISAEVGFGVIE